MLSCILMSNGGMNFMGVKVEKVSYGGWPNCYRVSNDKVDFVATTDIGPRIIRYGFVGEENQFCEFAEHMGKVGGDEWRIYGGHRLWHSPEDKVRTYFPDNYLVDVEVLETGLILRQNVETTTGIRKEIEITLDPDSTEVTLVQRLYNEGMWDVELAPWSISVMRPGGCAVVPHTQEAHPDGLLPNRVLILWPYTKMNDPRISWGERYTILRQDSKAESPVKFGLSVTDGWGMYVNDGVLFLKNFYYFEGEVYPDGGASLEVYTNNRMLELETLGPVTVIEPGGMVEHEEGWQIFKGAPLSVSEEDVESKLFPLIEA